MSNPSAATPAALRIRRAEEADLAALVALENAVFDYDRMSARQYRRHLDNANAELLVAHDGERIAGVAVLFFRRDSDLARLYSIAIAPDARGRRLGETLLDAAERTAAGRGARRMRLEVKPDNASARRLYARAGYREIGVKPAYYDDGADAVRYEKTLQAREEERRPAP